ncbi:hypothetical protein L9F63_017352, partial [Diploptera punctata]
YRVSVLVLTYAAYTCYHLSRKPISVVKNVLNQNCSDYPLPDGIILNNITNKDNWCDWAPFGGKDSATLLGALDSAYLFSYAISMFFSGFVAERVNLRYFLALGMIFSGILSYAFGIAKSYGIHQMWYFVLVQMLSGIVQSTGWPGVVTVVGNWFGKKKRGFIFGVWNSHTSMGNILGSLIAGYYVEYDWSLSFIVPGILIAGMGFILFLFLVVKPSDVGCIPPGQTSHERGFYSGYERVSTEEPTENGLSPESDDNEMVSDEQELTHRPQREDTPIISTNVAVEKPIGFLGALKIPGVVEYSLCLFFAKLVSYTFLYWLPLYIKASTKTETPTSSAELSTWFDVGGIVGAIVAGSVSDYFGKSACTCASMLILAVPTMFLYEDYGTEGRALNILLLNVVGFLVNGPYALITTAVSAELGTHHSLEGNSKALATVTAIIDGTGSIGAAVGPLLAGMVSNKGWQYVFIMLMTSSGFALLLLTRLVRREIKTSSLGHYLSWI